MKQEVDEIEELPEIEEGQEDTTDWKALALKNQGIAKRLRTKSEKLAEKLAEKPPEPEGIKPPEKPEKPSELTSGDKALLKSYLNIQGADELALVKNWMERTGDSLDNLIADDIFNARLNSLREAKASQEATPTTKRGVVSSKDSVDFWIDKPFEEVPDNLRQDVLNAKLKKEKKESMFTDKPVVM